MPPPGATPPPADPAAADMQRSTDAPPEPAPVTLDNPDDFTMKPGDQAIESGGPGIPPSQWVPETQGDQGEFVPEEGDQPIQYAPPGDPLEAGKEQIRQSILDRRGGVG